ncbi:bacteriohemerythrin [Natranaerobius thermophilus]|uniref:Hemerythrin-like metal-binding protein n=1 Tax=Natranaerobius thermophilus (strain ATCC BAA-1301 / DSM 18059 / JW/NM-WN-LF) TaxID=457570 RepID=B2A6U9_NATTJ|nr:hemerythrin family protein [Natranaerobius thermophilus]ACB84230.1 hemerythrin-like metal-binding protein [Natranaerobius thermophilus JW/NM-WN-LF]
MLWKDKYKIGVEEIDRQHKELFERVGNFLKVVRSDENWEDKLDTVKETLEFMKEYVVIHFDSEEAFQKKIDFPGYEEHKEIHENFKQEVEEYARRFEEENYNEELVQEFGGKLMAWLINHVAATDQKIGEYVESQEGGSHSES